MKTKKFEKLNLSKFDAFKQNELTFFASLSIEGGSTGTVINGKVSDADGYDGGGSQTVRTYTRNDGF